MYTLGGAHVVSVLMIPGPTLNPYRPEALQPPNQQTHRQSKAKPIVW
jgi:hypothetical protein